MPDVQASLEFLADLPLYEHEKPFLALITPHDGFNPDRERMDNLEWENHRDIIIRDIRGQNEPLTVNACGFQVSQHSTRISKFDDPDALRAYRDETERLLSSVFPESQVVCYDLKV